MTKDQDSRELELIRAFREGDENAFRDLLARCEGALEDRIRQCLPRKLDRKIAVSDLLQESCLLAYQRRRDLEARGPQAFRNWLLGIVEMKAREAIRHHCGVAKRSSRREVTRTRRLRTGEYPSAGPTPSQVAIGAELEQLAREAMDALPEDYREVLRLTREERLGLKDVATRMGRSHDAAKQLCGRALRRFREILDRLRGETRA